MAQGQRKLAGQVCALQRSNRKQLSPHCLSNTLYAKKQWSAFLCGIDDVLPPDCALPWTTIVDCDSFPNRLCGPAPGFSTAGGGCKLIMMDYVLLFDL
jgi:hypothetical protein